MVFTMVPTILNGKAIRTQDFMIYNIIQSFNFMKPLYFAVTVETSVDGVTGGAPQFWKPHNNARGAWYGGSGLYLNPE